MIAVALADVVLLGAAAVYVVASVLLLILGLNLIALSIIAWRAGRIGGTRESGIGGAAAAPGGDVSDRAVDDPGLPSVTVQLPIFNELYVAERIIGAAAALQYPADRLQIQVLDDSTDETAQLIAETVQRLAADGIDIVHQHRTDRSGYKAGALAAGMATATGEFVAVFDADFVP
ncbi:MAG: glycosyltransferase, partial [Actinomycetota bacterium]